MIKPEVIYLLIEEMIEKRNWEEAFKYAKQLDKGIGYFTKYVITKKIISEMEQDKILQEYYEFKKGI